MSAIGDLTPSLSLCSALNISEQVMGVFAIWGVQGLVSVRTYALCQGYQPVAIATAIMFLTLLALRIYGATLPSCITSTAVPRGPIIASTIENVMELLLDVLAFAAVVRQIWGLWKLKKSLGLLGNTDLATTLLGQGIIRFSFVLLVTTSEIFVVFFVPFTTYLINPFQNALSALLICQFTLDLRRRNAIKSVPDQPATLGLPTMSFRQGNPTQSVRSRLGWLHESIVAEMGEINTSAVHIDGPGLAEPDDIMQDNLNVVQVV